MNRAETIAQIKADLERRSGKKWSVTGGRGTGWGWLRIDVPPSERKYDFQTGEALHNGEYGAMSKERRAELAALLALDKPAPPQGESIPAGSDYWQEYLDRAAGRTPSKYGKPYWD